MSRAWGDAGQAERHWGPSEWAEFVFHAFITSLCLRDSSIPPASQLLPALLGSVALLLHRVWPEERPGGAAGVGECDRWLLGSSGTVVVCCACIRLHDGSDTITHEMPLTLPATSANFIVAFHRSSRHRRVPPVHRNKDRLCSDNVTGLAGRLTLHWGYCSGRGQRGLTNDQMSCGSGSSASVVRATLLLPTNTQAMQAIWKDPEKVQLLDEATQYTK